MRKIRNRKEEESWGNIKKGQQKEEKWEEN